MAMIRSQTMCGLLIVRERERDPNLPEAFHTSLSCLEIINISSLQLEADTMLLRTKESLIN